MLLRKLFITVKPEGGDGFITEREKHSGLL